MDQDKTNLQHYPVVPLVFIWSATMWNFIATKSPTFMDVTNFRHMTTPLMRTSFRLRMPRMGPDLRGWKDIVGMRWSTAEKK